MADAAVGIALGVLMAIASGLAVLRHITRWNDRPATWKQVASAPSLYRLPLYWLGGPLAGSRMLSVVSWKSLLAWYLPALAVVFTGIVIVPLYRLVVHCGNQFGDDANRSQRRLTSGGDD